MDVSRIVAMMFAILWSSIACGPTTSAEAHPKPIETTVCEILKNPSTYNNKLVRVRGLVRAGAEYSILVGTESCSEGLWLALGDATAFPAMVLTVDGRGPSGADAKKRLSRTLPIHLVRDSNYLEFISYLEASAKGESCTEEASPAFPPDCRTYRVTATLTGRIDSVSKEVHLSHLKRSSRDAPDGKGFGHMGLFDAQLVVQSVENVVAKSGQDQN